MVHQSLIANFLILSDNRTGVVVITSEHPSDKDFVNQMFEIQNGLNILEDRGVQKVSICKWSLKIKYM